MSNGDEGYDNSDTVIREPRPAGYVCIAAISRAMDSHTCVEAVYSPFDKPKYSLLLAPYCLRVFRGRCYVVGFSSAHIGYAILALEGLGFLQFHLVGFGNVCSDVDVLPYSPGKHEVVATL